MVAHDTEMVDDAYNTIEVVAVAAAAGIAVFNVADATAAAAAAVDTAAAAGESAGRCSAPNEAPSGVSYVVLFISCNETKEANNFLACTCYYEML